MALQEHNYWLTTAEFPKTDAAHRLPERVDVAVIGAGFTGLSAARTLAKRGASVAVLESETVGWGASSRNGGMVLTGMKLGVNKLISMYGRELTRRMYAASLETIDCVEQIVREEGIDCDFSRCGHLEVACKQKHFDDYARQAEVIAREFDHQLRVVQRHELSAEIGSTIYYGGMVDEVSAGVNPARYVAGLGHAAIKAGAEIFEHTRVEGVLRESSQGESGWKITTSRGTLWAREVFVGTSGYTSKATPALQKKIIPIGSFIITTEVLPEALAHELSPRNRMIYDSKELSLLLSPHARPPHVVRRPRRILSRERPDHSQERRNPAPWHGRRLSPTTRRQSRIRLGRHARLRLRHHAPRWSDRRHVLRRSATPDTASPWLRIKVRKWRI